jgi:hypothetical protein
MYPCDDDDDDDDDAFLNRKLIFSSMLQKVGNMAGNQDHVFWRHVVREEDAAPLLIWVEISTRQEGKNVFSDKSKTFLGAC